MVSLCFILLAIFFSIHIVSNGGLIIFYVNRSGFLNVVINVFNLLVLSVALDLHGTLGICRLCDKTIILFDSVLLVLLFLMVLLLRVVSD